MYPIQSLALLSVARACAYVGLGIMTIMVALSYDPMLCIRSGAILVSMLTVVLRWRALRADRIDYRHSEVWAMLDAADMPPADHAARLIRNAYRAALLRFADYSLYMAAALWAIAFVIWLWA